MSATFECVPNVSEGRDADIIAACADAITRSGAHLAHQTSDPIHHRTVFTFFGDAGAVERAAGELALVCVERIDVRAHRGVHPRLGALDVFPVVPMGGATLAEAAATARSAARRMWAQAGLPSIFYGAAANVPERELLADVRRGEFEGLPAREALGERPDTGDRLFHASAGAAAVGARPILIAVNLDLRGAEPALARAIARRLRERSGGLRGLRALAFASGDRIQLSFNVTDTDGVPLGRLVDLARLAAGRAGASIGATELIGLIPRSAAVNAVERAFEG